MGTVASRIASGTIWLSAGQLAGMAIAFIGSVVIARLLGPDYYGLLSIALIFPNLLPGLFDFGMSEALVRYSADDKREHFVRSIFHFKLLSSIIILIILFFFSGYLASLLSRPEVGPLIRILSLYSFSLIIVESIRRILVGKGKFVNVFVIDFLRNFLRIIITIILIIFGYSIYGAAWGFSLGLFSTMILSLKFVSNLFMRGVDYSRSTITEIFSYSLPLYVPILIGIPLHQAINIYLVKFVTDADMGNFSVASNLILPLSLIGSSVSLAVFSGLSSLSDNTERIKGAVIDVAFYTSLFLLPLAGGMIAFSDAIVWILYGSQYTTAPIYLAMLVVPVFMYPIASYPIADLFKSIGLTKYNMKINIAYLAVYLPVSIYLIPISGVKGILIANIISSMVSASYSLLLIRRIYKIIPVNRKIILFYLLTIIVTLFMYLINLEYGNKLQYILFFLLIFISQILIIYAVVFDDEELLEVKLLLQGIGIIGKILSKIIDLIIFIRRLIKGSGG